PGGQAGPISATLSISPTGGPLAGAIKFAADPKATPGDAPTSVTSHLPVPATPPPAPNPGWNRGGGEITLQQRAGIVSADLWLGVHNRIQWTHTDSTGKSTTQGLVQMPQRVS